MGMGESTMNIIDSNEEFLFYNIGRKEASIVQVDEEGVFHYKSAIHYTEEENRLCFETLRQRA